MIRPVVCVSANAEADLNLLWAGSQKDADDGDLCAIVLEELETNPKLQAMLLSDRAGKFEANGTTVKQWKEHYNKGKDLWILKLWDAQATLCSQRIIYAYFIQTKQFHILAIANRKFDYAIDHPITQRILRDYEALLGS